MVSVYLYREQEHVKSSARPARVSTASNSSLISDVDTEAEFQLSEFEDDSTWEKEVHKC